MNNLDKQIIEMYNDQSKSTYEIAKCLDTYPNKIRRTLIKHGYKLKDKSQAQKNALKSGRCAHPTAGKKRTQDEKLRISEGMETHWEKMTEEQRQDRVNQAKERWKKMDASQKEKMCRLATDAIRKAGKEGSKLEKFVMDKLIESGYTVDFHNKTLIPNEKLEIDLYIPALKTIIEVDGPSHFLPIWGEEKLQKQIKADLQKSGRILSRGFAIIRVKAIANASLKKKENLISNIVSTLKSIEKKFPPKTKRFIEVEL
jgi:very-short-patch-repair endonuclease